MSKYLKQKSEFLHSSFCGCATYNHCVTVFTTVYNVDIHYTRITPVKAARWYHPILGVMIPTSTVLVFINISWRDCSGIEPSNKCCGRN